MFRVPSSTPPSTPGSHRSSRNAPSTTPAGPAPNESYYPPSSTPAGLPPSRGGNLFGTSRPNFERPNNYNFNTSLFGSSPPKHGLLEGIGSGEIGTSTMGRPATQRGRTASSGFRVPSSPSHDGEEENDGYSEEEDDDDEMLDEDEDEEGMDEDDEDASGEDDDDYMAGQRRTKPQNRLSQSVVSRNSTSELQQGPTLVRPGAKQSRFDLLALAKGLTPTLDRATLQDPDFVILETERLVEKIQESMNNDTPERRGDVLGDVAQDLVALWQNAPQKPRGLSSSRSGSIAGLMNASRMASLLLNIHHSPLITQTQRPAALSLIPARPESRHYTPLPKTLLDWLNNTYSAVSEVELVLKETRGYSRHVNFWDAVSASAFRGNFVQTLELLKGAKFEYAETAQIDGLGDHGYSGSHLRYANEAVHVAIDLLHDCPAVAAEDWDVKGHDWNIFRQRAHQAYIDLQEFAEGDSANRHSVSQPFQASHFGISQSQASFHLSVASRKAESRVPWSIYENLSKLYQQLVGNEEELLAVSADWIEAVVGLTVWWDGEDDEEAHGSLAASRRAMMRSQRVRPVDVTPVKAYCQRLASSLAAVIENSDEDFSVNTTDRFEVGIACIIDDNVEGALQILRSWSLPVASAVAEVASAGEWFVRADGILNQFDQSDLMVLSYTEQQRTGVSKDDLLIAYSKLLAFKEQLRSQEGDIAKEGWELAVQVLGRLDNSVTANERIEKILNELQLQSAERVDKITQLCHNMGLSSHALSIALKYADHLRANTQNYGDTLLYYARAHAAPKIQEVLRVLVAHCLVKSIAYPPLDELDNSLSKLITSPKQTLTELARLDSDAAQLLSNYLSGYATIRKFYDLRDEEVLLKDGEKPTHRPMGRKRIAANALMVIISSAASSIQGGLYDPDVETVVQVDVLLALLGEALVFVNQSKRTLTLRHLYDLLTAIEDLETAPSMIRAQCEECLATTLSAAHDSYSSPTNPHRILQKSTSNLTTASSQYSLIGSTEFSSVEGQSTEGSAVLIKGGHVDESKRGWDWRKGFPKGVKGEEVIRILRLAIAREIGRAFAEGEVVA